MILLDCGNSSIKAQYHAVDGLRSSLSCRYQADWCERLQHWLAASAGAPLYLCSVLDAERQAALERSLHGFEVQRFVSEAQTLGVVNGYREPSRLGSDRWMALLGAAQECQADCIVIDAGSAITVDLLSAGGRHLGGAILPGFNTTAETFRQIFRHIDFNALSASEHRGPGCSTETAIQIDYANGSIDGLPTLVKRWIPLLDETPALLLTGGDAARVQALLDYPGRIIPDLVFRGMRRLVNA